MLEHLRDAMDAPSPCDGCTLATRCAMRELACSAFSMFAAGLPMKRWQYADRAPTRAKFKALFAGLA
jgi:hypothetical protein